MKTTSNFIHQLIHSLTKNEKGYFVKLLSLTRFLVFNNFVSAITGVSAIFFDFSKKFVGGTGFF
jgi:hypothetical protein